MKSCILTTFGLFFTLICFGQFTTGTNSSPDTLRYDRGKVYWQNRIIKPKEYAPMLMKFPSSGNEYKKYLRGAFAGTFFILAGTASGIIALTRLRKKEGLFTPYTITLVAADAVGISIIGLVNKHFRKSIQLYNSEIQR